jgi:peptidoglycan lytic transglycosylase
MGGGGGWAGRIGACIALVCAVALAGCSSRTAVSPPSIQYPPGQEPIVVGVASWYGPGFDGKRTASGEIYNQDDMTAASNIFALGTRVMVTNLDNGRSVVVRINDRGPFVKGRKLDLSHGAARVLGIVNPGTAKVRMAVLSAPAGVEPIRERPLYFVQAGSFAEPSHAQDVRERLEAYYSDVRIDPVDLAGHRYYRVRMGAFDTREAAQARAQASARLGLPMLIVSE